MTRRNLAYLVLNEPRIVDGSGTPQHMECFIHYSGAIGTPEQVNIWNFFMTPEKLDTNYFGTPSLPKRPIIVWISYVGHDVGEFD